MTIFLLKEALYNINLQCSWGSEMDGEKESCEEVKNGYCAQHLAPWNRLFIFSALRSKT